MKKQTCVIVRDDPVRFLDSIRLDSDSCIYGFTSSPKAALKFSCADEALVAIEFLSCVIDCELEDLLEVIPYPAENASEEVDINV